MLDVFTLKFTVFPFDNLNPLVPIANTISIIAPNFINLFSDINWVPFGNSTSVPPTSFLDLPDQNPPSVSPLICSETSSSQLIKFSMLDNVVINSCTLGVFLLSGRALNIRIKRSLPNSPALPAFSIKLAPKGSAGSILGSDLPSIVISSSAFSVDII